jgi:hypothetical protein
MNMKKQFPPMDLLVQAGTDAAEKKTRRLDRLYHLTQTHAWDGKATLAALIDKHGPPGKGMPEEIRAPLSRLLTVLMWGELAAWNISADLALGIDDVDAKMAATGQVFDEARHFTVLRDYVMALGPTPELGALPRALLRKVLDAPTLAKKLVGMQLLFETNAVVIFRGIAESNVCPILTEILPYFERDESRHVGLGVMFFPKMAEQMSKSEAKSTLRFQTQCVLLLMASGFTFRSDFRKLGLDPRAMATRVTRMQDDVVGDMVTHHGEGIARVVLNPRRGFGPKILDWIHPPDGIENASPTHQTVHRGVTRALTAIDRALS